MDTTKTTQKNPKKESFPIVAIGASAGGLEAINDLLKYLPADTGMAFIYIQHLDPDHKSMLSEILATHTSMQVQEARHLLHIERNQVYIIPPNKDMALVDGVLTLNQRKARPTIHMPIDKFFVSLAEKQKEGAIGVLLSGSNHDGSFGLKTIKTAGGITFAQDETAKFQTMPRSAIAEGVVDMILSPREIALELERLSRQPAIYEVLAPEEEDREDTTADADLSDIIQLLRKSTGVDFTHYKITTIRRRIIRRMLLYKIGTLKEYYQYLKLHTNEVAVLYQDMLIHVTNFFRDPDTIEYLRKTILPQLIKGKSSNEVLRVWVPACSSGEEAYSLAMTIVEVMDDIPMQVPIQIFATDLSDVAIAKARMGLYSRNELANVSPKQVQRFFSKVDGSYRVVKSIRDFCVFAPHNIFRDPPFTRLDLISCCNLMIYVDTVLQKKVIATFHYALNNKGFLILGKSETIGTSGQLFTQLEKKYKVYTKKKLSPDKMEFVLSYRQREPDQNEKIKKQVKPLPDYITDLEKTIDNVLLQKYVPASVVINNDLEILQFRGSTSLFLEPSPGKASLNLLKMARPGLIFELRSAIHKCNKSGEPIKKSGVEIKNNGIVQQISFEVMPLPSEGEEKLFLIVFYEVVQSTAPAKPILSKDKLVQQLQEELLNTKEDIRSILEEQEASTEELQSANEEIISSNEELQSINEELETSKEEVESTNEELMTINSELQLKNEQLAEAHEYSQAVFDTIGEAFVLLDKELRVKSANRTFYRMFRVNEDEIEGVPIYELDEKRWNIPELIKLLREILPQNKEFNNYQLEYNGYGSERKTLLLNARKMMQNQNRQQLILLAIENITERKNAEKLRAERDIWLRNMVENVPALVWMSDVNKNRNFFNKAWIDYTGHDPASNGTDWTEYIHKEDLDKYKAIFDKSFRDRLDYQVEFRLRRIDGEYRWMHENGRPAFNNEVFTGYIGSSTEIHEKKVVQEELEKQVIKRTQDLQKLNKELSRSNSELEQFAYVASHDLQEPLRKILTFSERIGQYTDSIPLEAKKYVEKISQSSQRMSRLIDDLLNFSRISKPDGGFVPVNLTESLKNALTDFDEIVLQKKASVKYEVLPTIQAIPIQMEQLFHNLLSNSLKFSRESEPPVIKISAIQKNGHSNQPANNNNSLRYEIIVEDNGIGFEAEYAEHIFTIFQRLNASHEFPGTGIGLALCRRIISNHGGEIHARSEVNKGASFHITLPVTQSTKPE